MIIMENAGVTLEKFVTDGAGAVPDLRTSIKNQLLIFQYLSEFLEINMKKVVYKEAQKNKQYTEYDLFQFCMRIECVTAYCISTQTLVTVYP